MATEVTTMTSTTNQRILSSAQKRQDLLRTMQETEYAITAASSADAKINNIQYQMSTVDKHIAQLHVTTEQARHQVESDQRSHTRKAFHGRATWAARQAQDQRQLDQSEQKEKAERQQRKHLAQDLAQTQSEKATVDADQARHSQAQNKLTQLYESVFAGPCPNFPEHDEKREAVSALQGQHQQTQLRLQTEQHAMDALNNSFQCLQVAMQNLQSSNTMATVDIFAGGDLVDLMERQKLAQAQQALTQCIVNLNEARRIQPLIAPLPDVFIDQGHLLSNVVFNCAITDFMQAQRIQNTVQQCQMAVGQLQGSVAQQQMRLSSVQANAARVTREIEAARKDLWMYRSRAFDSVVAEASGTTTFA